MPSTWSGNNGGVFDTSANALLIGNASSQSTNIFQTAGSGRSATVYVGGNNTRDVNQFLITGGTFTTTAQTYLGAQWFAFVTNTLNVFSNGGGIYAAGNGIVFGNTAVSSANSGNITNQIFFLGNGTLGAGTTTLNAGITIGYSQCI